MVYPCELFNKERRLDYAILNFILPFKNPVEGRLEFDMSALFAIL